MAQTWESPPSRTTQKVQLRFLARRPSIVAVTVLMVAWVFFAPNYWVFTASSAIVLAFNALGMVVLVGWAREISLAQAALVGTAVYVAGYLYRPGNGGQGWPFWFAVFGAVVFVAVLGSLASIVSLRLSGVYVMVLTLVMQFTIERVVFTKGILTGGATPFSTPRPWFFGVDLESDRAFYFFLLLLLGAVLLMMTRLRHSRYGRSLLFVGSNRRAAAALGISPWRYKLFAFALAAALGGFAGALSAALFGAPPNAFNYSAPTSLFYLGLPVLAGFESLVAAVVVAFSFTVLPQALESYKLSAPLLGGFALVIGTLLGPRGLGGLVMDRRRRLRRRQWRRGGGSEAYVELTSDGAPPAVFANVGLDSYAPLDERRQAALEVLEAFLPPTGDSDVALAASDVSIAFGGVQALRGASISVPTGALVGLIGSNGAGKSTLFDIVNGLKRPAAGTVELFGKDVTRLRAWDRAALGMSRTFQANRINPHLPVSVNLLSGAHRMIRGSLPGVVAGLRRSWADERRAEDAAWAVAVLLEVDRHWDEVAGALSFGNRRRVEIGRSLLAGPRLLLLDEPAAGLDPKAANVLFSLVKRLHADLGLSVLLVEHYVQAVLDNCDLVYVIDHGQIMAVGTAEEIALHPEVRSRYLGLDFRSSTVTGRADDA